MFSPVPMLRLDALVLSRDARCVLTDLGRRGAVELIRTGSAQGAAPVQSANAARCGQLLARIAELRRSLGSLGSPPVRASEPETPHGVATNLEEADAILRAIEEQSALLLTKRQLLLQRQAETSALCDQLTGFEGLEIPLDLQGRAEFLHFVIGTVPGEKLDKLRNEAGPHAILLPQPPRGEKRTIIALASREHRDRLDAALCRADFRRETLPATSGATTTTLFETKRRECDSFPAERAELDAALQSFLASSAKPLAEIERAATAEQRLLDAEQYFGRTEATSQLTGWIPAARAAAIAARLRELTRDRCAVSFAPPGEIPGEEIPVLLDHPRWLRPFAMLVTAFGFPTYRELEPTFFLAVSYVLMFGLMFGDVGHGLVLALGGLVAMRAGRAADVRDAGLLLVYAGASSLLFGVIYGSFFGLPQFKRLALWHDPIEGDPLHLLYAAIGFGIAMISVGLVLNIVNRFRRGDVLGGSLDKFGIAGLVFYWGSLALVSSIVEKSRITVLVLIILPVLCWILKGALASRHPASRIPNPESHGSHPSSVLTCAESVVEAFEGVLVFLANTISFVRLAAYAMSHAALLMAFFLMAESVREATAIGGLAIVVIGNAIAIALEGVIAAVQALRLEYYEFFGKFFSGGGRPFRPFVVWSPQS